MTKRARKLADLELARIEAVHKLCEFSSEVIQSGQQLQTLMVVVRYEGGPVVSAEISFRNLRNH